MNEEKLSELQQKMKPKMPDVREIYIEVMKASKVLQASDEHVLEAFINSLQGIGLDILSFEASFKLPREDQLKEFNDECRFLRTLLMDRPWQYNEPENINKLFRSIEMVAIGSGFLLFSLYVKEMNEEIGKQLNFMLVDLLEKIKSIKIKARRIYFKFPKPSKSRFPKIDGLGFVMFFLENLKDLLSSRHDSIDFMKHHIQTMQTDFMFLISFLGNREQHFHEHEELRSLWTRVLDVAYRAEYIIDSSVIKDSPLGYHLLLLEDVVEEIQLVKVDATQIHSRMLHDTVVSNISEPSNSVQLLESRSPKIKEHCVGFEDEAEKVIELLTGPSTELDTVSIVGMPGLGKTILAKKVYNSVLVEKHFHIRSWCSISQIYQKKDLLLSMLNHIMVLEENMFEMDLDDLAQVLYKSLKGRRYLMVMDDIWNIEAWHDLRMCFPDDENGSRILFTTRVLDVALQAKLHSKPHFLRLFNHNECWELLEQLIFSKGRCPSELEHIGRQIAKSCKGLPLSIVLIAGLLAVVKTKDFWEGILRNMTSTIIDVSQTPGMNII